MRIINTFKKANKKIEIENGNLSFFEGGNFVYVGGMNANIQGQGIGTELIRKLIEYCRNNNKKFIYMEQHDLDGRPYRIMKKVPNSITRAFISEKEFNEDVSNTERLCFHHSFFGEVCRIDEISSPEYYAPLFIETELV